VLDPSVRSSIGALTVRGLLVEALGFSAVFLFGAMLVGLLAVGSIARVVRVFIKPDTVYPLYGFHYAVHRVIARLGRLEFFPLLFGDSSYIVYFLSWFGYRLSPVVQTGSNFGCEVTTSNPFLTRIGSGTMVADGLNMINDEISSSSFRVSQVTIGPNNFFGNYVYYPFAGRLDDNYQLDDTCWLSLGNNARQ